MNTRDSAAALLAERLLPVGAECVAGPDKGVHFRVWAPRRQRVAVVLERNAEVYDEFALQAEGNGYFSGTVTNAKAGDHYCYRLDGDNSYPDPASRFQPEGPHGPSEIVTPRAFQWHDQAWPGLQLKGQVFYEMHIGTFTAEGTWAAAEQQLPGLAELGITAIEVMPVAAFPGKFGWGYDGTAWFAPSELYGRPDDFRRFVDRAHTLGIGVILDVVYNHFGPSGCYLREFAEEYFNTQHASEWGDTPNFDQPGCADVREFFIANAAYWIAEFHLDGLRLDATQSIHDQSEPHVLLEMGKRARAASGKRSLVIVNENEPQHARLVRPEERGGYGLDMIWNDDWHHSAIVSLTGQDEAYYTDYRGKPQEFISAAKHGFLFQGQWYRWQAQRRGTPCFDIEPARFVHFLANHDQVANSGTGARPHTLTSPARWRAMTALLLLGPQTPLLFQGQEFSASAPFLYFADHEAELAKLVEAGRRQFMCQFANLLDPDMAAAMLAPHDKASFERSKIDHAQRDLPGHREVWQLHRDLLHLRRTDPCFAAQALRGVDGAVLGEQAFVLRYFGEDGDDRLLVINLGSTLHLDPVPEPLLAPPQEHRWRVHWSSQAQCYGGGGVLMPDAPESDLAVSGRDLPRPAENWRIQGESAFVLAPEFCEQEISP